MSEDKFKTMSGRDVTLRIYVQQKNISKVDHAMVSLKHAMKWDEDTFGTIEQSIHLARCANVQAQLAAVLTASCSAL